MMQTLLSSLSHPNCSNSALTEDDLEVESLMYVWMWLGGFFLRVIKGIYKHVPPKTTKFEVCTVVCPVYNHVNSWLAALVWKQSKCGLVHTKSMILS